MYTHVLTLKVLFSLALPSTAIFLLPRTFINVHYFLALPDISTHFQVDFSELDLSVLLFSLTSFRRSLSFPFFLHSCRFSLRLLC